MKDWFARPAVRLCVGLLSTAAIVVPLGVMWAQSLVPSTYSVMDMGYADYGGGAQIKGEGPGHGRHGASGVSVATLTGPATGPPDVTVNLVARAEPFVLRSGQRVRGYTLNHSSPGPVIRAKQGDLVQVTLQNENVTDGTTLHWHGIDVPNAEDGVAGVTQDAVGIGSKQVYRFIAEDPGTYWYHSHQVSHVQVRRGLFGVFVISPAVPGPAAAKDVLGVAHSYGGISTINGKSGQDHVSMPGGSSVRVRVVNTNNGPLHTWVTGSTYAVAAIDGFDLNQPPAVRNRSLLLAAGGRADLLLTTPTDGSTIRIDIGGGKTHLTLGAQRSVVRNSPRPQRQVDLLSYGSPKPIEFDPAAADRRFRYDIGHRPGFVDGKPGMWWSINGGLFPNVPMFMVAEDDIVRMTIKNTSGRVHPMHLHGHHAVVLSRNGVRASGSPWWVDSLNVADDETYEIAFRADNPGIWMDHCHNLDHAADGLVAHLAYLGVSGSFQVGGKVRNHPE